MINIAVIFSPKLSFVNEFFKKIIIRYIINNTATDVKRASHTHQVPHMGLPQSEPVTSARNVKAVPMGAVARATTNAVRCRQMRPAAHAPASAM